MSKSTIILLALLGLVFISTFVGCGKYNTLVSAEESIDAQWAQVENQYQRRFDLIDNLVNTVKGYADFEQGTLIAVTEARAAALGAMSKASGGKNLDELQQADRTVGVAMGRFFGYTEQYPDLKANANFRDLQASLEGTENRVSTERMRYNEAVKQFNAGIRRFPGNIVAGIAGMEKREYFETITPDAQNVPKVSFD